VDQLPDSGSTSISGIRTVGSRETSPPRLKFPIRSNAIARFRYCAAHESLSQFLHFVCFSAPSGNAYRLVRSTIHSSLLWFIKTLGCFSYFFFFCCFFVFLFLNTFSLHRCQSVRLWGSQDEPAHLSGNVFSPTERQLHIHHAPCTDASRDP